MRRVAPPSATGAAGVRFEDRIHAFNMFRMMLGHLYPDSGLPYADHGVIQSIVFQAGTEGVETDDELLTIQRSDGTLARVLVQVKLGLEFTESHIDFKSFCKDAWKDFTDPFAFDPDKDVIVLVTGQLSRPEVEHVLHLNRLAKAKPSGDTYISALKQTSRTGKLKYVERFRSVLESESGCKITNEDLWRFMKCVHIWSSDFDNPVGRDQRNVETVILSVFNQLANDTPVGFWARLTQAASDANQVGATVTAQSMDASLMNCIRPKHIVPIYNFSMLRTALNTVEPAVKRYFSEDYYKEVATELIECVEAAHEIIMTHDWLRIIEFYKSYLVPVGDGRELNEALEQLLKMITLCCSAYPDWRFGNVPQLNVQLSSSSYARFIFSVHKEKMTAILIGIASNTAPKMKAFPYPILMDNYQRHTKHNVCSMCKHQQFDFGHIIHNFCRPSHIGPFNEEANSEHLNETVNVICSDCFLARAEACETISELHIFIKECFP